MAHLTWWWLELIECIKTNTQYRLLLFHFKDYFVVVYWNSILMTTVRTFHSKTLIFSLSNPFYEIMNETSYTYYKGYENNKQSQFRRYFPFSVLESSVRFFQTVQELTHLNISVLFTISSNHYHIIHNFKLY